MFNMYEALEIVSDIDAMGYFIHAGYFQYFEDKKRDQTIAVYQWNVSHTNKIASRKEKQ